jgi:hypothetical protein
MPIEMIPPVNESESPNTALLTPYFEQKEILNLELKKETAKTYSTRYSLVVTDPTTNRALPGLTTGERTGPGALQVQ